MTEVSMRRCPSCEDTWIIEEYGETCQSCTDQYHADMNAMDLLDAANNLQYLSKKAISKRMSIIKEAYNVIGHFIQTLETDKTCKTTSKNSKSS